MRSWNRLIFNIKKLYFFQEFIGFIKSGYWLVPLTWGVVVIYSSPLFNNRYSSDSMGYILIGNNLLSGLGYVSQAIRDFYIENTSAFAEPSRSFPPVLPILIGIFTKLFGKGIASSILVNIFALLALFHVHYLISKELFGKYFYLIFLMLPFFALANDPFLDEVVSGRSIPLAALLVSCIIYLVTRGERDRRSAFLLGGALGLLYLTRADTLIFCFLVLAYCATRNNNRKELLMLFAGLSIVVVPWTIRNMVTFGQFFASDNSVTALSTFKSTVPLCYFDTAIPWWKDDPNLWVTQRIGYFIENVKIIIELLLPFGGIYALLIAAVGLVSTRISKGVKPLFTLTLMWLLSHTFALSFTPFHDHRYYSVSVFLVAVCAIVTVMSFVLSIETQPRVSTGYALLSKRRYLFPILTLIISVSVVNYFVKDALSREDGNAATYKKIYSDFKGFINSNEDRVANGNAEHLAYYTTWRTIYLPFNTQQLDDQDFVAWKTKFKVTFALVPDDSIMVNHPMALIAASSGGMSLLDLREIKKASDSASDSFYNLTDSNWTNGVAKNWAGFFVANSSANLAELRPGKTVIFSDGSERVIVKQVQSGPYLNIDLSGPPLDGAKVGYPNKFKVQ